MTMDQATSRGKDRGYVEHPGKAVELDERFKLAMAVTLDPRMDYKEGIIRCITSRTGDPGLHGNRDRSELHLVHGDSLEHFKIGERLIIRNEDEVIGRLMDATDDFIGLEDPDIWIDPGTGLMHVYFTIPIIAANGGIAIHLGHAVGKGLDSLEMTEPALRSVPETGQSAKEVSIAPVNKAGLRYNLVESRILAPERNYGYSTVRVAIARDMGKPWEYGDTLFNPGERNMPWLGGDASPGPLLSRDFLDVGEGRRVGFINGRALGYVEDGIKKHGVFSVGLFIYNYEHGKIDWVSPEPFIVDSEAKNITFASQFVEQKGQTGILYAHVDDSFVRAYTVTAEGVKMFLP